MVGILKVSFQGERGAYSEEAGVAYFGEEIEFDPCRSLREVFDKVAVERADYGVVPAENSIEGTITQAYDLLLTTKLKITGEVVHPIKHNLVALPGVKLSDVRAVYSHPQALAQCQNYLEKLGVQSIAMYDTAGSAKLISEGTVKNAAAIASDRAVEIYGLHILGRNIQDYSENLTRFFILGRGDSVPTGRDKTSIVFGVKHEPGSLYQVLREFAERKLNLTKIESRPVKGKPWEYHFYLDFEGHQNEPAVKGALIKLVNLTTYIKVLGSYPRQRETSG